LTSVFLKPDLIRDEGLRLEAYPDPITGGHPWTIGVGHTGVLVHPGLVWTKAEALDQLQRDIEFFESGLDEDWTKSWWRQMSDLRQDCLVNIAFNIGLHGLMEFTTFLTLLSKQHYPQAALDLRGTLWFHQVGDRAVRVANQLASNIHQE
jgi:lysozyme